MISEEEIEFIDWSLVPIEDIIPDIIKKFGTSIEELKARLWLEDLFSQIEIKVEEEKYPDSIFFFIEEKWYMEYNSRTKTLWCSHKRIWSFLENYFSLFEMQSFLKNVIEQHFSFDGLKPKSISEFEKFEDLIENHFKNATVEKAGRLHEYFVEHNFKILKFERKIEENVESIDWITIPLEQITPKIVKKFISSFPLIILRLWLEEIFQNLIVKTDEEKFPGYVFFFYGDKIYLEVSLEGVYVALSYEKIWSVMKTEYDLSYIRIKEILLMILKNNDFLKSYLPVNEIIFSSRNNLGKDMWAKTVADIFRSSYSSFVYTSSDKLEKHFKND